MFYTPGDLILGKFGQNLLSKFAENQVSRYIKHFEVFFFNSVCYNDSSSVMLPMELRKVQWLEWPVGDPM